MMDMGSERAGGPTTIETAHIHARFTAEGSDHVGWVVEGATVTTRISHPYVIVIDLATDRVDADPMALFGAAGELTIVREELENAYGGIISSVHERGHAYTGFVRARVTLEPALAVLRHGRDSRIFQDMTVPAILELVLGRELGAYGRGVLLELRRTYPAREYTVQYEESHFDFVQRLMEEEGIFYYFVQEGGLERLVLVDSGAQYPRLEGEHLLAYSDVEGDASAHTAEYVRSFEHRLDLGGTAVATRHFDWTHPSALITGAAADDDGPPRESYQHDEAFTLHAFGGAYAASDVRDQVSIRQEAQRRDRELFEGRSTVRSIRAGYRFDLTGHPDGLDGSYVVVEATHRVLGHAQGAGGERYGNELSAAPADTAWRPARTRARPRIRGIQTAIVTGPPGEEIHCDEHGRVKVQFHWDRLGAGDDHTSCWIRVMQTAAGAGFGAWVLPRVGWEVVVSFVDGDPDRPLVTGCVYNGELPLPYALPEHKARTLLKTNSYPGGGGYNELRFDDTKSAEEIFLHGEKDWNTVIENDLTRRVGHDETQHVGNDRTRTVVANESLAVGMNRTRVVGVDETVTVGANRTRSVGANETASVAGNQTLSVTGDRTRSVAGSEQVGVNGDQQIGIGAGRQTSVANDDQLQVGGDRTVQVVGSQAVAVGVDENYRVGKNADRKVGASSNEKVGKTRTRKVGKLENINVGIAQMINVKAVRMVTAGMVQMLNAGKMMMLKAGSKIELGCGGAKITLKKDGTITLTGKQILVEASGGDVVVKGDAIRLN